MFGGQVISGCETSHYNTVTARSAIAVALAGHDPASTTTLFAKEPHLPVSPASLAKLAAAMVALDTLETLGEDWAGYPMRVEEADAAGGSGNYLRTGDVISMQGALGGMLLPSSNVSAAMVAR